MPRPVQSRDNMSPVISGRDTGDRTPAKRRGAGRLRRLSTSGERTEVALSYAMGTWAAAESEPLPEGVDRVEPLGDPCHYRVHLAKGHGVGHAEFCGLADGFFVHFCNITHPGPYPMSVSAPDMLRIRIASDDDGEYAPTKGDLLDLNGPGAAIIIEPAGQPPAEAVLAGRNHAANVFIHRSVLQRLYEGRELELPAVLQAFVAGSLRQTVARRLPLGPALLRALEDLQQCDIEGHSRRLFLSSKALEILCHAFKALSQEDDLASQDASVQTRRGVLKARQLLATQFAAPPSLDDLAHLVGLSRSSLCAGFRQILGVTVFDYIADLRMQHALKLLGESTAPITQIAYDVGFSHPSSFSLAVQRRFGATPSALRRRGLSAA